MSASLPNPPAAEPSRRRSRALGAGVIAYVAILGAAIATRQGWLDEIAAMLLASLFLAPSLRRGSRAAWLFWIATAALLAALAWRGRGEIALDLLPVIVNAALCLLFAGTLDAAREPLIARLIGAIEGASRLALPGVGTYARRLTLAWALFLGMQAAALLVIVLFRSPDGLLQALGIDPPFALRGAFWPGYVHVGSYVGVIAFFVLEYIFRRLHLRDIPHVPPARFAAQLIRRWPAIARSFADDEPKHPA